MDEVAGVPAERDEIVRVKLPARVDVDRDHMMDLEVFSPAAGDAGRLLGEVLASDAGPLARPGCSEDCFANPSEHGFRLRRPGRSTEVAPALCLGVYGQLTQRRPQHLPAARRMLAGVGCVI